MRTPMEKGFCCMTRPEVFIIEKVSRALWPIASIRASASMIRASENPFPAILTAFRRPSSITSDSSLVSKRISPPSLSTFFLIFTITSRSTSVPICGLARYMMSSPAPASRNSFSTSRMRLSFIPVPIFPSEKVPAPPSPKSMFASGSSNLSLLNLSTASMRPSMAGPRSSTSGL